MSGVKHGVAWSVAPSIDIKQDASSLLASLLYSARVRIPLKRNSFLAEKQLRGG